MESRALSYTINCNAQVKTTELQRQSAVNLLQLCTTHYDNLQILSGYEHAEMRRFQ